MSKYFDMLAYLMGKQAGGGGGGDVTVESKSISANGTYTAPAGKAYSPVTVNVQNSYAAGDEGKVVSGGQLVSQTAHAEVDTNGTIDTTLNNSVVVNVPTGGGGYGYTKLAEQDFTVNTSSTSETSVGTINAGASAWTTAKIVYVRVRDKAGKRDGYFFGVDRFFINPNPSWHTPTSMIIGSPIIIRYDNSVFRAASNSQGVYPSEIAINGDIPIKARYNAVNTLTINGTYHVEVYALDWPDGVSPFN